MGIHWTRRLPTRDVLALGLALATGIGGPSLAALDRGDCTRPR